MSEGGQVADSVRSVTVRRQGARPSSGAKRQADKQTRLQLHLGESIVKRLNVHAALVGRNTSRVAEEILSAWLCRFGKGREIFGDTELTPEESAA
jgi:hypothetical protein